MSASAPRSPVWSAVVPTLGKSPLLEAALRALRDQATPGEIVLVSSGGAELPAAVRRLPDRVLTVSERLGFASATNRGIAAAEGELVATVNDDAVVAPGWATALLTALGALPRAAAAQGANLRLGTAICDGWGVGWNRRLQAVQLGHGEAPPATAAPAREVFGVSATAAVYRRSALAAVALPDGAFDPRLDSFYEDVDLACRLRGAGFTALSVPAARAEHAVSTSAAAVPLRRWRLVYGNRWLVLARLLGSSFWGRIPGLLGRDAADCVSALLHGEGARGLGAATGVWRAALRLRRFARRGTPLVAPAELARWRAEGGGR